MNICIELLKITLNHKHIFYEDSDGNLIPIHNLAFTFQLSSFHHFLYNALRIFFFEDGYLFKRCIGFAEIPFVAFFTKSVLYYEIYNKSFLNIYQCYGSERVPCGWLCLRVKTNLNNFDSVEIIAENGKNILNEDYRNEKDDYTELSKEKEKIEIKAKSGVNSAINGLSEINNYNSSLCSNQSGVDMNINIQNNKESKEIKIENIMQKIFSYDAGDNNFNDKNGLRQLHIERKHVTENKNTDCSILLEKNFKTNKISKINRTVVINEVIKKVKFVENRTIYKNSLFDNMFFSTIIGQEKRQEYYLYILKIWRIYTYISKGSIMCKFHFWVGLFYLEGHYRNESKRYELSTNKISKIGYFHDKLLKIDDVHNNEKYIHSNDLSNQDNDRGHIYLNPCYLSDDNLTTRRKKSVEINEFEDYDDSYALIHHKFYEYYLNKYYYAIAPYGKYYLTILSVKERCKPDFRVVEPNRSIISYLNIDKSDFIYAKLNLKETKTPHIAFYDIVEEELVISFRGTFNHVDALNDLDCEYTPFFDGYAHAGFVKLADSFIDLHLSDLSVLLAKRNYKKILFTGQSLGGALCVLVQIILEKKQYNFKSRAIAFSAPPTVSENLCEQSNIINIVYGYDIISRLCFGSLLDLKFVSTSLSKLKVSDKENISKIFSYLHENDIHPKLYIPGTLYHIRKFSMGKETIVMGKEADKNDFTKIVVHHKCFLHHTFPAVINSFTQGINESKKNNLFINKS